MLDHPIAEGVDEGTQLLAASAATAVGDQRRQLFGRDDARGHGVLPVVTDIGDAVGPGNDFAFWGRRRGAAP